MADMKHTPGPWTLFNDGKCVAGPESTAGAGHGVAMCSMRARSDEEARANARLIAAAPDLLAALKQIAFARPAGETPKKIDGKLIERIEIIALTALSKAGA